MVWTFLFLKVFIFIPMLWNFRGPEGYVQKNSFLPCLIPRPPSCSLQRHLLKFLLGNLFNSGLIPCGGCVWSLCRFLGPGTVEAAWLHDGASASGARVSFTFRVAWQLRVFFPLCSCSMRKLNWSSILSRSKNSRSTNWWRRLKNWRMIPFPSSWR